MSTRAHYHPRDIEVDLADLPRWLYAEIASLHGQIVKDNSPLTCLGNGQPMYVYRHNAGRYYAKHYPGENPDGHGHRMVTMSDEHRRQTEYTQRAAEDHGLNTSMEYSTGNRTRLDLAVRGSQDTGFEIQRSTLSRAQAKSRAKRSFDAGWPTAWVTDQERAPSWTDHVPTARLTAGIDWTAHLPGRNTARVIISKFFRERDRNKSSGWHYRREPHAVPLDDLAYRMPAGEIVPVALGRLGAVSLAFAQAREVIDSCTHEGASVWSPVSDTPRTKEAVQQFTRDCAHHVTATLRCHGCNKTLPAGWPEGHPCRACEVLGGTS